MSAQNTVWIIAGVAVLVAGVGAAILISADGADRTASDVQTPALVETVAPPPVEDPVAAQTLNPAGEETTDATLADPSTEMTNPDDAPAETIEEIDPSSIDAAPTASGDEIAEPGEETETAPQPEESR